MAVISGRSIDLPPTTNQRAPASSAKVIWTDRVSGVAFEKAQPVKAADKVIGSILICSRDHRRSSADAGGKNTGTGTGSDGAGG